MFTAKDGRARKDGHRSYRHVPGFESVKLPTQAKCKIEIPTPTKMGNGKVGNRKVGGLRRHPNFSGRGSSPEMAQWGTRRRTANYLRLRHHMTRQDRDGQYGPLPDRDVPGVESVKIPTLMET